jgi:GntR family transcriptional repressor for pyruvate dehydrogenase complex
VERLTGAESNSRRELRIAPIPRVAMRELVLSRVNTYIVDSGLKPGDRLPSERELAEALQVSRPTVREAMRALEAVGKIEIRKNAGSFVLSPGGDAIVRQLRTAAPVDISSLPNLLQVRAAIEDRVVKLVAENADSDFSEARAALEQEADDIRHGLRSPFNLRFEQALGRQAGNPLLSELQRAIHEFWTAAWSECGVVPQESDESVLAQHRSILDALEHHEVDAARERTTSHFERIFVAPFEGQ